MIVRSEMPFTVTVRYACECVGIGVIPTDSIGAFAPTPFAAVFAVVAAATEGRKVKGVIEADVFLRIPGGIAAAWDAHHGLLHVLLVRIGEGLVVVRIGRI